MSEPVHVIRSVAQAGRLLQPERLRILEMLSEPDSASGLARRCGLPRQRLNYHLKELEKDGLVALDREQRKRNCTERIYRATVRSLVITPSLLGRLGVNEEIVRDKFSSSYLLSAGSRLVRDVATLQERAGKAGRPLATLTLETELRLGSPEARQQFTEDLLNAVAHVARKYHQPNAEGGRDYRLVLGAYPSPPKEK